MRRKKSKSNNNFIFFVLFLAVVALGVYFVFYYFNRPKPQPVPDLPVQAQQTTSSKPDQSQPTVDNPDLSEPASSASPKKPSVPQYEGKDPNQSSELTGTLTYVNVSGDRLTIRLNIDQFLSSGLCQLSLIQAGTTQYSVSADIISSASTSTCQGFDISTANLPKGHYQIQIALNSAGKTGQIIGEVNL